VDVRTISRVPFSPAFDEDMHRSEVEKVQVTLIVKSEKEMDCGLLFPPLPRKICTDKMNRGNMY